MSALPPRVAALLRYGAAPLLPPGSRLRGGVDPVDEVRRAAREDLDGVGPPSPAARLGASLLWPGLIAARALSNLRRHGADAARTAGVSRARQLLDLLQLAWRHDLAPNSYYDFRLFEPGNRARAESFIQHHELRALLRRINAGLDWSWLDDKRTFNAHCRAHDLPVPKVLAVCSGGDLLWVEPPERLPRRDLVLKPHLLRGGTGLERWLYDPARDGWTRRGETLPEPALLERARTRGAAQPLLIQERVHPHPDLADLEIAGVLGTVRVVTWRAPSGACGALETFLRMPGRAGAEVDNWHQGGIGAPIDLASGKLRHAYRGALRLDRHPVSGAPITGHPVPFAGELVPLCLRAHATLPGFWFVGWDVGIGRDGLVLIEANSIWGCPESPPLGDTPFPELALARLRELGAR